MKNTLQNLKNHNFEQDEEKCRTTKVQWFPGNTAKKG